MPTIAGPDGKRIAFPEGTSDSDIAAAFSQAPTPPVAPQPNSQPTAPPAPSAGEGLLHKGWDWLNSPLNIGHIRENIKAGENNDPSLEDAKDLAAHPILHPIKQGIKDFSTTFGTGAAKMLLTPLGVGMAAAGPLAEAPGLIGTAAKAVGGAAAVGFAGKGAVDAAQHPGMQPGENVADYATRMAGNAAMVLGGVGAGAHVAQAHMSKTSQAPTPPAVQNTAAPDPVVAAQARVQQAVGGLGVPVDQTIHVDPDFATELDAWNRNKQLPGKRVILKTNPKSGKQTVHLAHSDPDVSGFQYTNTTSSNVYSNDGVPGQVPVELSKSNGVRGTATKGHFLANQIVGDIPNAAPETPAPAPAAPQTIQPPSPEVTPPPAPSVATPENSLGAHPEYDAMAREVGSDGLTNMQRAQQKALTDKSRPPEGFLPHTQSEKDMIEGSTGRPYDPVRDAGMFRRTYGTSPTTVDKVVTPADPTRGIKEVKLPVTQGEVTPSVANPVSKTGVPQYIQDTIDSDNAIANRMGVANKIEDLSAQGFVANQIRSRLQPEFDSAKIDVADQNRIVRSVRAKRGIPSQDNMSEFEAWRQNRQAQPLSSRGVSPGQNPLPTELSKSAPRFGYGNKLFQLQFDDPHDLAAYTLGQAKDNAAQAKFVKYLQSEYPDATIQDLKDHALGVRSVVKDLAKNGNPDEGPLKVPSQGGIATSADDTKGPIQQAPEEPKFPTTQTSTPKLAKTDPDEPKTKYELANALHPETKQGVAADTWAGGAEAVHTKEELQQLYRQMKAKTSPESQASTPPAEAKPLADVSPLEDKIRPLVGQVMRLGQLRTGEAASHAIDTAIEQTHSLTGGLDEGLQKQMSSLLKEPVGKNLTNAQIDKLESMRGASVSKEPKVLSGLAKTPNGRTIQDEEMEKDPDAWQRRLDASMVAMTQALNDPNTSPELAKKLTNALTDREDRPWLYEKDTVQYPKPQPLDPSHPEAPFASSKLGHEITRINLRNYASILGSEPKDLFLGRDIKSGFVSPEENQQYEDLKDSNLKEVSGNFGLEDLIGRTDEFGNSTGSGSKFSAANSTSPEFRAFDRDLRQRVLARKLAQTIQSLKGRVGEWNKQRNGASTALTEQLAKLSPDVRKYLPEELFDYEKPGGSQANNPSTTTGDEQPIKTANKVKASSAAPKSGLETSVEGIKTNKFDGILAKKFPDATEHIPLLRAGIADKYAPENRQTIYNQAMDVFHQGLVADDPFALKKAVDVIKRTSEAGFVNVGSGDVFSPEELHSINAATADAFLTRWEKMSDSELAKKKDGLRKDSLVDRIQGAAPTSSDPVVRQDQTDTYNELLERHNLLKERAGPTTNLHDSMTEWAQSFVEDRADKQMLREEMGRTYRNNAILKNTFEGVDKLMNNLPLPEQDRFFDNMSRGDAINDKLFQAMDPKFIQKWEKTNGPVPDPNDLAQRIRDSFDAARDRVTQASGHLSEFIVNYMPGMYDNQAAARNFAQSWASRRPLEGSSEFLKQKMYEFHSDALKAGLQPTTSNPVRAMMMRVEQLNRFAMAHEFKNRLVDGGFADWYNTGETPPEGHEALNDRIFGQGGLGNYFAPSKVARTFNNFVSTGLTGGWKVPYTNLSLYDVIKSTNNLANMMQLGFSVFHGVETTLNAGFTTMAKGLRQTINEGKVASGVGNFLKGSTFIAPIIEDAWNGQKGLINFRDPTKELNYAQLGSDLEAANANVRTNPGFELQQIQRLKENWSRASDGLMPARSRAVALAKSAGNLLSAGVEATSYPLMSSLIPRVKVGAFYKMAQQIHEEMVGQPPDAINQELQKAWDSVDNRFGQVNYDNLFMNKTMKDIMALSVRSPGWNIGTLREVGGGAFDAARSVKNAAQGNGFKISNRTAYTASMVAGTMFVNAMYHYLHTGQQAQGMDYFFPKDGTKSSQGEDNRVYPKTYVYDFINLYHDPIHTAWHKAAPDISTMADIIQNEDYYHHEIRDPGNTPLQNAGSVLGYMAHQFVPFSLGNLNEAQLRGSTSKIESFGGILPAPRWVGRSNAENLAYNYFEKTQATDASDPVSLEKKKDFIMLRNKVAQGTITDDQIQDALDKGKIQPKMIQYLYETKNDPQIVSWTKNLRSSEHVWNVWQAATPEEKKTLLSTVIEKVVNLDSGEEQGKKLEELENFANSQ